MKILVVSILISILILACNSLFFENGFVLNLESIFISFKSQLHSKLVSLIGGYTSKIKKEASPLKQEYITKMANTIIKAWRKHPLLLELTPTELIIYNGSSHRESEGIFVILKQERYEKTNERTDKITPQLVVPRSACPPELLKEVEVEMKASGINVYTPSVKIRIEDLLTTDSGGMTKFLQAFWGHKDSLLPIENIVKDNYFNVLAPSADKYPQDINLEHSVQVSRYHGAQASNFALREKERTIHGNILEHIHQIKGDLQLANSPFYSTSTVPGLKQGNNVALLSDLADSAVEASNKCISVNELLVNKDYDKFRLYNASYLSELDYSRKEEKEKIERIFSVKGGERILNKNLQGLRPKMAVKKTLIDIDDLD